MICKKGNIKLMGDVCKSCARGLKEFKYDIDILETAVIYLRESK